MRNLLSHFALIVRTGLRSLTWDLIGDVFVLVRSFHAKTWLSLTLVALAIPVALNAVVPRKTAFRIVAETGVIAGIVNPSSASRPSGLTIQKGYVCADTISALDNVGNPSLCPGFAYTLPVSNALVTFERRSRLVLTRTSTEQLAITISPDTEGRTAATRPTISIEQPEQPQEGESVVDFLLSDEGPQADEMVRALGPVQIILSDLKGAPGPLMVLEMNGIAVGNDVSTSSTLPAPVMVKGKVELYGLGFFSDFLQLFRSNLLPQGGYVRLGEFSLNFADVARFAPSFDDQSEPNGFLTISTQDRHLLVSGWVVSPEAVISAYGSSGYVLKPSPIDRLINDPLLNYWSAIALTLLTLWIRAVLSESLANRLPPEV